MPNAWERSWNCELINKHSMDEYGSLNMFYEAPITNNKK